MKYKHYVGPKNPIVNVETDVPAYPISEREKYPYGHRIAKDEAIYLLSSRQYCRFKDVSEAFST